ncbi:MAG: M23 family metallopeptidase [Archangium sp.]|nr:M23 family metallopeptidase [Archangium sp.]MDP3155144.1 M23 family metallopeptidase [Archangium sp.]MDP3573345.1 M23 family metallopeptidase [Archangium sp.]
MIVGALLTLVVVAGLEVRIQPGVARPGDAVLVEVTGATEAPSGQLGSAELVFLPYGDRWVSLTGLSVDHKPGVMGLEVTGESTAGKQRVDGELEVRKPDFRRRQLTVSKRFTSISKKDRLRSAEDQKAFDETFDRDFEPWIFEARFAWPRLDGVGAPFGDLRLFNGKKKSQHFGTDINGETGDPITAANDGEVVLVRDCFGSGGTVILHHGGRLFTSYFHMSAFSVKQGERVVRGQPLGKVGQSGRVTGPHLHFGVKLDGRWIDPESLLRLEFSDRPTSPAASPGKP